VLEPCAELRTSQQRAKEREIESDGRVRTGTAGGAPTEAIDREESTTMATEMGGRTMFGERGMKIVLPVFATAVSLLIAGCGAGRGLKWVIRPHLHGERSNSAGSFQCERANSHHRHFG